MRLPQFRIRTVMISIAFLALLLTVAYQQILLRRAAAREELLRAVAAQVRAMEERARVLAEAQAKRAQDALNQFETIRKSRIR